MSDSREKIRSALLELVARRDATVFQDADNFEKLVQNIGNFPAMPEISALKAGLKERFPWELQKDSDGTVSSRTQQALAQQLVKRHGFNEEISFWAIETWAAALGLKVELVTPVAKTPAAVANKPVIAEPDTSSTRLGMIFGTDEAGQIKVFKSWFDAAPPQESARLIASTIKIEKKKATPLFTAAAKKKKPRTSTSLPPAPAANPTAAPANSPRMVKQAAQPKPTNPAPAQTKVMQPPPKGDGADELLARATYYLPGGGGKVDVREALGLLQLSVKKGSLAARRKFGEIYLKGIGVKENLPNAANWYKTAAEFGDAESQFQLGSLFQCGIGVEYSMEMAQIWLQRAAEQGHEGAKDLIKQILRA